MFCDTKKMTDTLIEIRKLSFSHENGVNVFQDVNIAIPQGKITAIMGPSGTGKTTLLRLISGQLFPSAGTVMVDGQLIHELSRRELYKLRHSMGMLFQAGGLFTHLTVYENVAFPLREHTKLSEAMIHTLVLAKLEMVGLRGAEKLYANQLSGGMARRVALARAIALDPNLIMYDEPFTGQDPISMSVLVKLIHTLNSALGLTSIIVSHDVQETLSIADYVYVIANNSVVGYGTPTEIMNHSSPVLQQFIHGLPDGPMMFNYPARALKEDFLQEATA